VRTKNGRCFLVETKGQVDRDVPLKARAAVEWSKGATWEYVFVLEGVFHRFNGSEFRLLAKSCEPSLRDLLAGDTPTADLPLFAGTAMLEEKTPTGQSVVPQECLDALPDRLKRAADEAISLFRFFENKPGVNHAPVFTALLGVVDEAAKNLVTRKLTPHMPANQVDQQDWFFPYLQKIDPRMRRHYEDLGRNLRKTLVYRSGVSPLGMLRSCLDYALNDSAKIDGVFDTMKSEMKFAGARDLLDRVTGMNDFRNNHVAHQEQPLVDPAQSKKALREWIEAMGALWKAAEHAP